MSQANNNYNGEERRSNERRGSRDRRYAVRFEDVQGRRTGVDRRINCEDNNETSN